MTCFKRFAKDVHLHNHNASKMRNLHSNKLII